MGTVARSYHPANNTMRWLQTEYILKGIYLGLLLFLALRLPDWPTAGWVALFTLAGLGVGLGLASLRKFRQGYRIRGRWLSFLLVLLLDSPGLVYAGVLLGTAAGAVYVTPAKTAVADQAPPVVIDTPETTPQNPPPLEPQSFQQWLAQRDYSQLLSFVGGGAVLGCLFGALRSVRRAVVRLGLSLALAVALVAGALALFGQFGETGFHQLIPSNTALFGAELLFGIPIFYLLTFAGKEEESEIEIGAMCAALGLGCWMLVADVHQFQHEMQPVRSTTFIIPLALYFLYTTRILPGLRVFKHALRGLSYLQMGKFRLSLLSLRRALQLDPQNRLAREGLWQVHRTIDVRHLPNDPELLKLIDLNLCLERAGALLLEPRPSPARLEEAHRLLDLVISQRPDMEPRAQYWRAVAYTHAREYDRAAEELSQVLSHDRYAADDPQREAVLVQAWQLALLLHDELRRRVGLPQLAQPGRRMEALAAVERHLAREPEDKSLWGLKQALYQDVTEADYNAAAGGEDLALAYFDHLYVQQLGLALVNDPTRWQRGGEYLRLAARGLPATGPSIFMQIAQANQRANNAEGVWHNFELAKRAGRSVGAKNLQDEERQAYFTAVKYLAEDAASRGAIDEAIENYLLFSESERSGVETLRMLADLYERKGDPLLALRATEQALIYNNRDRDLLERKDRYYYSVLPQDLVARLDSVRDSFDVGYCLRKARSLLEMKNADLELIDWAQHLVELVRAIQPENVLARVLAARCQLRRGEVNEAVAMLEAVHSPKPERFATSEDEDAWYLCCRLLGDLYLNELGKPEQALQCYSDFRKSSKSGADTTFKMAQAYEQLGDWTRARRCYEQVSTYTEHPLAPEARNALYRLRTTS